MLKHKWVVDQLKKLKENGILNVKLNNVEVIEKTTGQKVEIT